MGERVGIRGVMGSSQGLECRVATGSREARVPRNRPGGARRGSRRQPPDRTRVLNRDTTRSSGCSAALVSRRLVVNRVDTRIGMLAPPSGDDTAEYEALLAWIGGVWMCRP